MKFIDIAFGATLAAFGLGSLAGALLTAFSLGFREFVFALVNIRVIGPVRTVSEWGGIALVFLIFLNNCIPVVLSFLYALIIVKVRWTPPMSLLLRNRLLSAFSLLTGSLLGFFNLGAPLMLIAEIRGSASVNTLLRTSSVHAPLEFLFVLACVAEPLRLTLRIEDRDKIVNTLRSDTILLLPCIIGLLASALIEVFAAL